jgi:hypothetical protein
MVGRAGWLRLLLAASQCHHSCAVLWSGPRAAAPGSWLAACLAGCSACCDAMAGCGCVGVGGGRPTCEAADYIRTLYCSQAGQSAKNCWLQKKPPCTERRVFGLSAHSPWKTLHTAHCCLASGRPMNYVKPSYPQRTAAEWRKFNAMK